MSLARRLASRLASRPARRLTSLGGGGGAIFGTFTASTTEPEEGANVTLTFTLESVHPSLVLDGVDLVCDPNAVTYQFQKDGSNIGTDSATLAITGFGADDNGSYTLRVTDDVTGASKVFGPLTIAIPESGGGGNEIIGTLGVSNQTPTEGDTVTFTFLLESVHPSLSLVGGNLVCDPNAVNFQYKKDGVNIGSNSNVLLLSNVDSGDDGSYTLDVTDPETSQTETFGPLTISVQAAAPITLANITTLQSAGWNIPDADEWWIPHPSPAQVKAALKAPFRNDPGVTGICIKRLYCPHDLGNASIGTDTPLTRLISTQNGPADHAALAWYRLQVQADNASYDIQMAQAKSEVLANNWTGLSLRGAGGNNDKAMGAVCAFDWIVWEDATEFEAAFDIVRNVVETQGWDTVANPSFKWSARGYYNNDPMYYTTLAARTLLALSVYGVNPAGASHTWAEAVLDDLGPEVDESSPHSYSPVHVANLMSLLSRGLGGGASMGDRNVFISSYEYYYTAAFFFYCWAFDTATNNTWDLMNTSLYGKTRANGGVLEEDMQVLRTGEISLSATTSVVEGLIRFFQDGKMRWILGRNRWKWNSGAADFTSIDNSANYAPIRMFAGPLPAVAGPTSGAVAATNGSRWFWKDDIATPEEGLRFRVTQDSLEYGRYPMPSRVFAFCYNDIGLVDAGMNRNVRVPAFANGLQIAEFLTGTNLTTNPSPLLSILSEGWPDDSAWTLEPYWNDSTVARNPSQIATNSAYVRNTAQFTEALGVYTLTQNWLGRLRPQYSGRVTTLTSSFEFTPSLNKLVILDTVAADSDVYVGWHFSPSHAVTVITGGFTFTDGTDVIQVLVEPLNGLELTLTQRDGFVLGDAASTVFGLDYHSDPPGGVNMAVERVAKNMGYTPTAHAAQYQVRVTIEVNP